MIWVPIIAAQVAATHLAEEQDFARKLEAASPEKREHMLRARKEMLEKREARRREEVEERRHRELVDAIAQSNRPGFMSGFFFGSMFK